jgi:hypothetical protein
MKTIIIFLILFLSCFTINAQVSCRKQFQPQLDKADSDFLARNDEIGKRWDKKWEKEQPTISSVGASNQELNDSRQKWEDEKAKIEKKIAECEGRQSQRMQGTVYGPAAKRLAEPDIQQPISAAASGGAATNSGSSSGSTKSSTTNTRTTNSRPKNSSKIGGASQINVSKNRTFYEQKAANQAATSAYWAQKREEAAARQAQDAAKAEQRAREQISGITSSALSRVNDHVAGTYRLRNSGGVRAYQEERGVTGQKASGAMDTNPNRAMPKRPLSGLLKGGNNKSSSIVMGANKVNTNKAVFVADENRVKDYVFRSEENIGKFIKLPDKDRNIQQFLPDQYKKVSGKDIRPLLEKDERTLTNEEKKMIAEYNGFAKKVSVEIDWQLTMADYSNTNPKGTSNSDLNQSMTASSDDSNPKGKPTGTPNRSYPAGSWKEFSNSNAKNDQNSELDRGYVQLATPPMWPSDFVPTSVMNNLNEQIEAKKKEQKKEEYKLFEMEDGSNPQIEMGKIMENKSLPELMKDPEKREIIEKTVNKTEKLGRQIVSSSKKINSDKLSEKEKEEEEEKAKIEQLKEEFEKTVDELTQNLPELSKKSEEIPEEEENNGESNESNNKSKKPE